MNPSPRHRRLIAAALLLGPAAYLGAEAVAAAAWSDPDYSYARNWISDLGSTTVGTFQGRQIDSPLHAVMNAGFVVHGALFALGLLLVSRDLPSRPRRAVVDVTLATTAGYVLLAVFPSTPEAAGNGTLALHFLGAVLAIIGGNALAVMLGLHWRKGPTHRRLGLVGILLGALGLVAVVVLVATMGTGAPAGLIERVSVYTVVAWQIAMAVAVLTTGAPDPAAGTATRPASDPSALGATPAP
jgi:hypothetical membrane protein